MIYETTTIFNEANWKSLGKWNLLADYTDKKME